jgi:glycosyltransferase involved in cell wall biosynthesis
MTLFAHYLRSWDVSSSARVDLFIANSKNVAFRIQKYFRRDSEIIYPPVDVDAFKNEQNHQPGDYYLMAGELTWYKRPDLAIDAFNASGRKLVVIGGGDMLREVQRKARSNVMVLGPQPFEQLRAYYSRCRALIFPGEEDFGIVPVEAMASGRPVIAFGRGGAKETVLDGITGVLFESQTCEAIENAIRRADQIAFSSDMIARHAAKFDRRRFMRQIEDTIDAALGNSNTPRIHLQTAAAHARSALTH